jgi:hypothetical protein
LKVNACSVVGYEFISCLLGEVWGEVNQHVRVHRISRERKPEDGGIVDRHITLLCDENLLELARNLRNQVLPSADEGRGCEDGGNAAHDLQEITT